MAARRNTIADRLERIEKILTILSKPVFTTEEAALYLGKAEQTVRNNLSDIPHFRKGGKLYFRREELDVWMRTADISREEEP